MEFKKTIAIDFDGVLNEYKGYDRKNLYQPRKKAKEFLIELNKKYTVIVFTSRLKFDVERWLKKHHLDEYVVRVTNDKPPAFAYIDDRGINFDGDYDKVLRKLDGFSTWWEMKMHD